MATDEQRDNTAASQQVTQQTEETTAAPEKQGDVKEQEVSQTQEVETAPKESEAWKQMRLENKRLKEELENRQKGERAFDSLFPKTESKAQTVQQAQAQHGSQYVDVNQFIDKDGNFDAVSYNQAVNSKISQLEQRITQYDQDRDEREARESIPQLNPSSKEYDPDFEQLVADRWLRLQVEGRGQTLKEVAQSFMKKSSKELDQAKKQGAQEAMESLSEKEQASLDVTPQTSSRARQAQAEADSAQLRSRVRQGDEAALARIMSRIPWANKNPQT